MLCAREDFLELAAAEHAAKRMLFPMWVISIKTFLEMKDGPPQSFQELFDEGKVIKWEPGMYVVFVSHEWVGMGKADPEGKQLSVLRQALKNVMSGNITVEFDAMTQVALHIDETFTAEEQARLADGYLWFDWMAIPQITVRREGDDPDMGSDVKKAVDSIPAYVDAANLVVILAPPLLHLARHETCDFYTWMTRGWCRVELAACALGRRQYVRCMVVQSEVQVMFWNRFSMFLMPGQGNFTVEFDRILVHSVIRIILDNALDYQRCRKDLARFRIYSAMQGHFLSGLGTDAEKEASRSVAIEDETSFLKRYDFQSLEDEGTDGIGPLACAAIAGNKALIRNIASLGNVNKKLQASFFELCAREGSTALHLAVLLNGDPDIVSLLLDLKADINAADSNGFVAIAAAFIFDRAECVQTLMERNFPLNWRDPHNNSCLHMAAIGLNEKCLAMLLEETTARELLDETIAQGLTPLMNAITFGVPACVNLLINAGANIHLHAKQYPLWSAIFSTVSFGLEWGIIKSSNALRTFAVCREATALAMAVHSGNVCAVNALLEARASVDEKNAQGLSIRDIAVRENHANMLSRCLEDCVAHKKRNAASMHIANMEA